MPLSRLDASILPSMSASRSLGNLVEEQWTAAHPDAEVLRRDLAASPVPTEAWQHAVTAGFVPEEERTAGQQAAVALAASLADELLTANALLFTVPLYNFGVAQTFKTWFDLTVTDPRIGLAPAALGGKPAVLTTVQGGNYRPGSPKEGWDHSTPWLRRVLEDVWGLDLRVVERPFTLVGVDPALEAFTGMASALKEDAETAAVKYGRELAGAVVPR